MEWKYGYGLCYYKFTVKGHFVKKCEKISRRRVFCALSAYGIITSLHNIIGKVGKEIIVLGDVLMDSTIKLEKREYFVPVIELYVFNQLDVLCMSNEENENEFDASELGSF